MSQDTLESSSRFISLSRNIKENILMRTPIKFISPTAVIGFPLKPSVISINLKGPPNELPNYRLIYNWYRVCSQGSNTKEKWLSSVKNYKPVEADLGYKLKAEVCATNSTTTELFSKAEEAKTDPVVHPPSRISRHFIDVNGTEGETFRVLTYNLLADHLAYGDPVTPSQHWAVDWEYRSQNLLAEIVEYNSDIICLQEVQTDHFETFLKLPLEQQGYELFYKKKTDSGVYTGQEHVTDGCATCVRTNRFKLLKMYELEFRNIFEEIKDGHRLQKDYIALVVVLQAISGNDTDLRICVANTHISADPRRPDIKLYQVAKLLEGLEKLSIAQVPILLCGDFNSLPRSNVYDLLVGGKVDKVKLMNDYDQLGIFSQLKLTHALNLKSAYSAAFQKLHDSSLPQGDIEKHLKSIDLVTYEPTFTTFTKTFSGAVDFILYTADDFEVDGFLELLNVADLGEHLISGYWSSDHIALMAKLRVIRSRMPADLPIDLWKQEERKG